MKPSFVRGIFLGVLAVSLLTLAARADTIEMKDGRVIHGKYVGGSMYNLRFMVNGKQELIPVKDVLNLSFDTTTNNSGNPTPVPASKAMPAAAGSVSSAAPAEITVPAATVLHVRMIDSVDSSTNKVGDQFRASLETALVVGDSVVAPKSADVYGRLIQAKSAGHISGSSELALELTSISINGRMVPISTGEYSVAGSGRGKQSAERIGGGAALGAIIGAIAGGGKGAAIGAGVGAGAGTAVQVMTHGQQVRVPSETLLDFKLDQPFTTVPAQPVSR